MDYVSSELSKIYYNAGDSGSYGGLERLYRRAIELGVKGITRKDVLNFLRGEHCYTLHKPSRKTFLRNRTQVSGIDIQWQADLADMQGLSRFNHGFKYLLTCIDVLSKYAWVVPIKTKSAKEMKEAFIKLLKEAYPRKPKRLQTDKGKEFLNKNVRALLNSEGIELFQTWSDKKAAVVERFNRTLKSRIWTYFTGKRTKEYLPVLQKLVHAYNHSHHRSIGMRPCDVDGKNENEVWHRLYQMPIPSRGKRELSITPGQMVRVSRTKGDFEKGYMPNWTEQHYRVSGTCPNVPRIYKLQNIRGEEIDGSYYKEDIQPINKNDFRIEKIIKRRTLATGKTEVLVKWKGWSDKFNTWVPCNDAGRPISGNSPK